MCLRARYISEERSEVAEDSYHLAAACFLPMTGGVGLGTVHDEVDP